MEQAASAFALLGSYLKKKKRKEKRSKPGGSELLKTRTPACDLSLNCDQLFPAVGVDSFAHKHFFFFHSVCPSQEKFNYLSGYLFAFSLYEMPRALWWCQETSPQVSGFQGSWGKVVLVVEELAPGHIIPCGRRRGRVGRARCFRRKGTYKRLKLSAQGYVCQAAGLLLG